jgi:hypothetical protein
VHLVGFIIKTFVTMDGHMNVKVAIFLLLPKDKIFYQVLMLTVSQISDVQ